MNSRRRRGHVIPFYKKLKYEGAASSGVHSSAKQSWSVWEFASNTLRAKRGFKKYEGIKTHATQGVDLSTAMDRVLEIADEVLPDGMGITFTGEAATLDDTEGGLYAVFGVALIVVLLVLSAQFEAALR